MTDILTIYIREFTVKITHIIHTHIHIYKRRFSVSYDAIFACVNFAGNFCRNSFPRRISKYDITAWNPESASKTQVGFLNLRSSSSSLFYCTYYSTIYSFAVIFFRNFIGGITSCFISVLEIFYLYSQPSPSSYALREFPMNFFVLVCAQYFTIKLNSFSTINSTSIYN